MYIYIYIYMYTSICIYTYAYRYIYTYVYMYKCVLEMQNINKYEQNRDDFMSISRQTRTKIYVHDDVKQAKVTGFYTRDKLQYE